MISEERRALIRNLYREYGSYRKVASLANVSDKTVKAIVLDLHKKTKKKPGPRPKLTSRDDRQIIKVAKRTLKAEEKVRASKIRAECNLQHVQIRTVQRRLKALGMEYKKANSSIDLTPLQKANRLKQSRSWIENAQDWSKVVFSDEKRFCGDGPDGWYSWMPQGQTIKRNKRQQGGPSVQVWGALIPGPLLTIYELPPRGDSTAFMNFLSQVHCLISDCSWVRILSSSKITIPLTCR